jgi:ABC-2 type transport system ATP-binding protein
MNTSISFKNVSKKYRIRHKKVSKHTVVQPRPGMLSRFLSFSGNGKLVKEDFWAIKDVSFQTEKGETIGIIGPNGAGKSTILKLLSGITRPTQGEITTNGRIGALIELGSGFHPELTGRENIYLNGSILGLKKRDIDRKFDQIVDFSELERFIDTPVKRYSSGMFVRLGFSVAVNIEPEILLIDEILAVGDKAFQRKSFEKLSQMRREGKTFLLVSHSLFQIENMCNRAVYLNQGEIITEGNVKDVISQYVDDTIKKSKGSPEEFQSAEIQLMNVRIVDESGNERENFFPEEPFTLEIDYIAHSAVESPTFIFAVRYGEFRIFSTNTKVLKTNLGTLRGEGTVRCSIKNLPLMPNAYEVDVGVWDKSQLRQMGALINKASLAIKLPRDGDFPYRASGNMGVVYGQSEWSKE